MSLLDPRSRMMTYLTSYLSVADITKDDGVTQASGWTGYSGVKSPLGLYFFGTKNHDYLITVEVPDTQPLVDYSGKIYAYDEKIPLQVWAINKTGITGEVLMWKAIREIRNAFELNPYGSYWSLTANNPATKDMGGWKLYSQTLTAQYIRSTGIAATVPSFSYGDDWIYEGDRTSGGVEGTWTLTTGGGSTTTQAVNSDNNLVLDHTVHVADSSTVNGTNLGLSTTVYPYLRYRYRTTGNATAKIIVTFSDAATQTILAETASTTWATAQVTLTAAKTVDHVTLYVCDGVGSAIYDFININKGTYIYPNALTLEETFTVNDASIPVPGRQGEVTQALGTSLSEVRIRSDIQIDAGVNVQQWKRPQTTGGASDDNNDDCLYECVHYNGDTHLWHWLNTGKRQFKARLIEVRPIDDGRQRQIETVWREYRHGGEETYGERFTV